MAKKLIPTDGHGNGIERKIQVKRKPQPKYVEPESITNYRRERDRSLWLLYPHLREELEEKWKS